MTFRLETFSKNRRRDLHAVVAGVAVAGLVASLAAGAEFESTGAVPTSRYLSPAETAGPEWKVAAQAENDGAMNTYRVESRFGTFEARGRNRVATRAKEVEALTELERVSKSDVFVDAVKQSAIGQVETVVSFATKPVETIKGIGSGAKRLFERTKYQVQEVKADAKTEYADYKEAKSEEKTDEQKAAQKDARQDQAQALAKQEALDYLKISGAERRWYATLGVDPYTDNEPLRKTIHSYARIEGLTRFGMKFVGMPSIPGIGELRDVMELVWETDPWDLRKRNRETLLALGLAEPVAREFEDNPWTSLSQQTAVVEAVKGLEGVGGREHLVSRTIDVESRDEAQQVVGSILLLARLHARERPLARVLPGSRLPVALAKDGSLQALALADALFWTADIADAASGFAGHYAREAAPRRELRVVGEASPRFVAECKSLGWTVITRWQPKAA